ncbi:MAG: hypothetical protein ACM3ST_07755 [Bdellovibrio bacteriovorus]
MGTNPSTSPRPAANTPIRDDETPGPLLKRHFEVASVEKVEGPDGGQEGDWYRYVLASGPARITGYHRGTPEQVSDYAESCAADFNLRNATGKSARSVASKKAR